MAKPRVYVDTSVFSALLDERTPERQRLTQGFWSRRPEFDLSTSELAREELEMTPDTGRRRDLLVLLDEVVVFPLTGEMRELGKQYVAEGCFPAAMLNDALHVAAAVLNRNEILISWNFRHLVNRIRRARVNACNVELGLPHLDIHAPPEL